MEDELKDKVIDFTVDSIAQLIPGVNIAIDIARVSKTIADHILLSKLRKFLFALKDLNEDEKHKFQDRLENNEKERQKIGELILIHLNHHDDTDKAEILGRIFVAYIQDHISFDQLRRLAMAIDLALVSDLLALANASKEEISRNADMMAALVRGGLILMSRSGMVIGDVVPPSFDITELGWLFMKLMKGG